MLSMPRPLLAALSVAAVLGTAPAAGAFPVGEQVNRGTGVAGSAGFSGTRSTPRLITNDGRLALFDHLVQGAAFATQSPAERASSGVYVRDLLQNTTVQLVSGNATATGLTQDQKTLSVLSAQQLTAADTDQTVDLYLADTASKVLTLVATGAAPVLTGAVTADGSAVVWSDAAGTYRRVRATGVTTTLSAAQLPSTVGVVNFVDGLLNQTVMSADGRVVSVVPGGSSGANSLAREGRPALAVGSAVAQTQAARLSADGKVAALFDSANRLVVVDVSTGASRRVTVTPTLTSYLPAITSVSTDGTSAVFRANEGAYNLSLTSGARAQIFTRPSNDFGDALFSANRRYALATSGGTGYYAYHGGQLFAFPIGTATLPGGVDLPSPFAYLGFSPGCDKIAFLSYPQLPRIDLYAVAGAPAPTSAYVVLRNRSGAIVRSGTILPGAAVRDLPIGWTGNWILDAQVTLAGGQVVKERWTQGGYGGTPDCQPFS